MARGNGNLNILIFELWRLKTLNLSLLLAVRWMEDSDREQIYHETLTDQYHLVKAETNM